MDLLDTSPEVVRAKQVQALQMEAQRLVAHARAIGIVLTISLESRQPPAMGNYDTVIQIREARRVS